MSADVSRARIEGATLAQCYARCASEGVRLAYLITGDRALAEDLVQDAFVKLTGRLVHLRDAHAFDAYLRRTIVNLANSHFRRRKLERRWLEHQAGQREALSGVMSEALDVSVKDQLKEALMSLPLRQRTAVVLRFYEDLSEAQTAELMRCRPGTVKSLVSRGLERLRPLVTEG